MTTRRLKIKGYLRNIHTRLSNLSRLQVLTVSRLVARLQSGQAFPCGCSGKGKTKLSASALEKCDERSRRPLHPLPESLQTPWRIRPATRTVKAVRINSHECKISLGPLPTLGIIGTLMPDAFFRLMGKCVFFISEISG